MERNVNRVSFIHSPEVYYEQNYGVRFVPLWAYTLAAYVPDSWEVSVYDCTIIDKSKIPEATVFAFSGINQDFRSIKSMHAYLKVKFPDSIFVLGGPMTWSYEKDGRLSELEYFDYLFILDGEETFPEFLKRVEAHRFDRIEKIIRGNRFPLVRARKLRFDLLKPNVRQYYGGVIEVSRGCPFLCEFCDIRVLPNNNESHNKEIDLIIEELDFYRRLGVRRVQLACDNFLGDPVWARKCVDQIVDWAGESGAKMALYTWITVNLSRRPDLMANMRKAGFTGLFIGVESFNANSILETAKIQNRNDQKQLPEALSHIQSYGFVVVPGLIFGFDSDPPTLFDDMLNGVIESGLLGGDPTFLLALPGTPLFERMRRTARLVEYDHTERTLALYQERVSKIESNIKYLQPRDFLIRGFMKFIGEFSSARVMYARFLKHVEIIVESNRFLSAHSIGYGSFTEYVKFQFSSFMNVKMFCCRMLHLFQPANLWAILKAYGLVLKYGRRCEGLMNHFTFWLFLWSNLLVKYRGLCEGHFKIHSIEADYNLEKLWNDATSVPPEILENGRDKDQVKVLNQTKRTQEAILLLKARLGVSYRLAYFGHE